MEREKTCPHTLLLHIGTPKTGTTSLQYFLLRNRDNLISDGWEYPDLVSELPEFQEEPGLVRYFNGHVLGVAYQNLVEKNDEDAKRKWDGLIKRILLHLEKYNVILSCEVFWLMDLEEFLNRLNKYYKNISVIVYLRRQDKYLESYWNQCVKVFFEARTIKEYSETTGKNSCRYLEKLKAVERVVGKRLLVRVYEKQFFAGGGKDIISDFLTVIGLDTETFKWEKIAPQNDRLNGNFLEIKRIFNTVYDRDECGTGYSEYDDLFLTLSQQNNRKETAKNKGFFTVEERKQILDAYAEENEEIARRFLNREDGILFQDMDVEIPCGYHQASPFEEDIIRTFSALIIMQKKQFKIQMKLMIAKEHRQLAYFGAGLICRTLLKAHDMKPDIIIDNFINDSTANGIPIMQADQIQKWNNLFIVITCRAHKEIEDQLQKKGLKRGENFVCWNECF